MKLRILLTGSNGQLGSEFRALAAQNADFADWTLAGRAEMDLAQAGAVRRFMDEHQFDIVINCAAYTAVDKAESEPEVAAQVNAWAVKELAEACARQNARLIHFSTDYVYHGLQNTAYRESDAVNPVGVYAQTKLQGERLAQDVMGCERLIIIRTSWVYSVFGNNFLKTMQRLGREREQLNVVADQIGAPTLAADLAQAVLDILKSERWSGGVYNYSNEGVASWYDFACAIMELSGLNCQVNPIETKDYPTPAVRPPFSLMNKGAFKATFGLGIPHWRDGLKRCLATQENA